MKKVRKIISFLLALVMVIGMIPSMEVHAVETESTVETMEEETVAETAAAATETIMETTEAATEAIEETVSPTEVLTEPTEEAIAEETVMEEVVSSDSMGASIVASGDCGIKVEWVLDTDGTLTLSGTGETWNVQDYEYTHRKALVKRIVIQEGITYLGWELFAGCSAATSVQMPDSLITIGYGAFMGCNSLVEVSIPNSVTSIESAAFQSCDSLKRVEFSENLSNLGAWAFIDCTSLTSVTIPGSLNSMGERVFDGCTGLTEVIVQDGVRRIGEYAFYNCTGLKNVRLPVGLHYIEKYAFWHCEALTDITIQNVVEIGEFAFDGCYSLQKAVLPESIRSIGTCAFANCWALESITIPENVTSIGGAAFGNCRSLTSIYFRGNAPEVGNVLFYWDQKVTAYYPEGDPTWSPDVRLKFGESVIWVPYTPENTEFDGTYDGEVSFFSENVANSNVEIPLSYNDSFFADSSYSYNHDLAKATLKLAMSAFVSDKSRRGDADGDAKNAYDFLKKIGCDSNAIRDYGYDSEPTTGSIACVIGSKQLKNQEETLLIVAVRGQGYAAEWGGNFEVGPNLTYHKGFEKAANTVIGRLNSYINSMEDISGPVKLWITGYSRAAATANIVAGKLVNGEESLPDKVTLKAKDLFAYTFETPAGVKSSHVPHAEKYHNIFNIINSTDFVPKVAPSIWGYSRFGIDCFLPDLSRENNSQVYTTYRELMGKPYTRPFEAPVRQSLFLELAVGKLAVTIGGEAMYVVEDQQTLINSCAEHNGLPGLEVLFNACLRRAALANAESIVLILDKANQIEFSHYPENCLAMMETLTDESAYWDGEYKYYIVKCPVDISVMDDSGSIVASIENDTVTRTGNENVDVYVDENGDKYVFVLDDTEYQLRLTATDNGEMDCTVVSYQQGQGKTSQSAFFDVPLVNGESYIAPFSMQDDQYVLQGNEGTLTPDVVINGGELYNAAVHVAITGNGTVFGAAACYSVGDTAHLTAVPEEGSIFGGWYADGELVCRDREYVFGIQGDCTLTAIFLSNEMALTLDQEYVALKTGETAQLIAKAQPAELTQLIQWHMEDDEETVASVDENGLVTANAVGTAYVIASVAVEETERTARCRIDVAGTEATEADNPVIALNGIQLGTTTLTTELFSTDYAEFNLMLQLPQNGNLMSTDRKNLPEDRGVAIDSAEFADEAAAEAFELIPLDDRRIAVVPAQSALDNPKELQKSYKSAVTVWVDGKKYTTEEVLTLTVKQSKPKLKATIPAFNAFYTGQTQEITVTGGTVTGITAKSLPDWLTLKADGTLALNENAAAKNAGKAVLLVETREWNIPVEISLAVKNTYQAPGLKLSASSVKMTADAAASSGVELKLQPKSKKDTLDSLNVADVLAPDGYEVKNFDSETGSFTLKAREGFETGRITLQVKMNGTTERVPLTLKVDVQKVSLKLSAKTITLNTALKDSAAVKVTATPADYILTDPVITGYDPEYLSVSFENGILTVETTEKTIADTTYKLSVSAGGSAAVVLSVKTVKKDPTVSFKASGSLDLSFPDNTVNVNPTFKNYSGGFAFAETETEQFTLKQDGNAISVQCKEGTNTGTYIQELTLTLGDGTPIKNTVKLTVKRTAVKLKLSSTKLSLNSAISDKASVTVICTTKGYDCKEPIVTVMDKSGKNPSDGLKAEYNDGGLTVSVNGNTKPDTTYKVLVQANEDAPAVTLTVSTLKENKSDITASLKLSGSLDVVRDGSAITVMPSYKNCGNTVERTEILQILDKDGRVIADSSWEKNETMNIRKDHQGRYILTRVPGALLDHTQKYTVKLIAGIDGNAPVTAETAMKLMMGSSKLTLTADNSVLFSRDIHSRVNFVLTAMDTQLNDISEVSIKSDKNKYDEKLEIHSYGNGEFAIGFKGETVHSSLIGKTVTVTVNIFLDGNETEKANTTAKLKVTILA